MEGVRPRQRLHETPVFMRVLQNPVVRNNAALGWAKSMEKQRDFHSFLRFLCLFSPVFSRNCLYFGRFYRRRISPKTRVHGPCRTPLNAARKAPSSSAKRRRDRRVQRIHHRRGQLEMANQRRRKAGIKRGFGRQRRVQSPLPALNQIQRRMIAWETLRRPRQCISFKFLKCLPKGCASARALRNSA